MAEALLVRSSAAAGCSAIARTMKRGELVAPGSSAMGLSSDFFCKKLASLVPKHSNTSGAKIRVGRGGPIRSKMFVPGTHFPTEFKHPVLSLQGGWSLS